MADQSCKPLQFFVRLLDGKSVTLTFSSPIACGEQIKQRIFEQTKIPTHLQRLISGGFQIPGASAISQSDTTMNLVLSLRGGKGGLGSLLRNVVMKAGQKKTNNFDSWRNFEKKALEYLKEQSNNAKQGVGDGATQKNVNKYKGESDKCILAVHLALNETFKNGNKRKGKKMGTAESEKSKRIKIWNGKRAVEDSDSDDSSDEEDEKSVVGGQVDSDHKDTDESSGSVLDGSHDGENDFVVHQSSDVVKGEITVVQRINEEKMDDFAVADAMDQLEKVEKSSGNDDFVVKRGGTAKERVCCKPVEPLNFAEFKSATDMEVLGMERLKTELQSRGLKCRGTLRERAARLFLLKSTPLDKLPKKLLAKK
ncbi:unnamed protein product [Arabidopsis thaliana]|uniref:Uncharacterized protein n=2 Tax=Arabidopsis TaxID=3701 RepID=A0A654F634_ARATH|nr:unnamed protein product [Arabidopsis thaliana]VYS56518.1 unnamed protein product [Arabidopsis thaliana]